MKIINLKHEPEPPSFKILGVLVFSLILLGITNVQSTKAIEGVEAKEVVSISNERGLEGSICIQEEWIGLEDTGGDGVEVRGGLQESNEPEQPEDIPIEKAIEVTPKQEVVAKNSVEVIEQGSTKAIPEEVKEFVEWYPGSRIDSEYLGLLNESCGDDSLLREVVAISVAEGAMGRDLPHRESNWWGWFKGGDRDYDPSREQMANDICTGIGDNYRGIGNSPELIARYTGNDRASNWKSIFSWAMSKM